MEWNTFDFFPVMGEALTAENCFQLDLSDQNLQLQHVNVADTSSFNAFIFDQLRQSGRTYAIGGYLEDRAIYRRSEVFASQSADTFRSIHLGVDIWCESFHPLFCPWEAKIHSFQDNVGYGDYGPTLILEHQLGNKRLFSLYGHLSQADLNTWAIGKRLAKGEKIGSVGPFPENGDWPPHLHFQLMWDLEGKSGDYPGVASRLERKKYARNCPDPAYLLGFPA